MSNVESFEFCTFAHWCTLFIHYYSLVTSETGYFKHVNKVDYSRFPPIMFPVVNKSLGVAHLVLMTSKLNTVFC